MSTPVQRQYWELKNQNPEAILFFRLGDFYEIFYEDAHLASRILGIALTARHKGTENEMPMCGFPHHAHESYLEQLINAGYKVAIAEQKEDEDKKITRHIDRIVTPGTSLEDGNIKAEQNNFLLSVGRDLKTNKHALAYSDLGTGEFRTIHLEDEISFLDEVWKINPKEILIPQSLFEDEDLCQKLPTSHLTLQPDLKIEAAKAILEKHFGKSALETFDLSSLGLLIEVSGVIMTYLQKTQQKELTHFKKITRYSTSERMLMDGQTLQHLEVFQPIYGNEGATLYSVFEKAHTPMGGRKLFQYLGNPLQKIETIKKRQTAIQELLESSARQSELSKLLAPIYDLERLIGKLVTGKGNARDMITLKNGLIAFPALQEFCKTSHSDHLISKSGNFKGLEQLKALIDKTIIESPPTEITEGGIINKGIDKNLDELRILAKDANKWLEEYLEKEKQRSGINTLRIKYSKNFGFCIESSKAQATSAPENWIRRQTLVNAERFTTPELSAHEDKILSSENKIKEIEYEIFLQLRDEVLSYSELIQIASQTIGQIDVLSILARTAKKNRWVIPNIHEENTLIIREGRHPVVEKISDQPFISNDLVMKDDHFHLITGPNMAGKSTYLRQNAIIIFLAQIGSAVPAKSAQLPIFDRIFTRVGASDNLAGGKSTFFVEMTETAKIILNSTDKSFVILDEIGRGTSTFDGLSLAWAISEYLHDAIACKTLFATHYHELIDLAQDLTRANNFHVSAKQKKDGIIFLHKIMPGGIADSFGIEVAKSAGIPSQIIHESRLILSQLESENLLSKTPNLFSTPRVIEKEITKESKIEKKLKSIDIDALSPKEAHNLLYELQSDINDFETSVQNS